MPQIRRSNKTLPAERIRALKDLAVKIDREDRPRLSKMANASLDAHEALVALLSRLREERERQGLSLAAVADRAGMDKANLSRLENSDNVNPTFSTLQRYAEALGLVLRIDVASVR